MAHTPGWVSPLSGSVIQTRASIRRTPSTNQIVSGVGIVGSGGIGAQSSSERSTVASTGPVDSSRVAWSTDAP